MEKASQTPKRAKICNIGRHEYTSFKVIAIRMLNRSIVYLLLTLDHIIIQMMAE
jgi:hypothetical protein